MADKKVTDLTSLTTGASEDLFLVVDDPNGTPASKSITHKNLFGAVSSNVVISKLTTLNANVTINCSNTSRSLYTNRAYKRWFQHSTTVTLKLTFP